MHSFTFPPVDPLSLNFDVLVIVLHALHLLCRIRYLSGVVPLDLYCMRGLDGT